MSSGRVQVGLILQVLADLLGLTKASKESASQHWRGALREHLQARTLRMNVSAQLSQRSTNVMLVLLSLAELPSKQQICV